jgi:hypothetical protein
MEMARQCPSKSRVVTLQPYKNKSFLFDAILASFLSFAPQSSYPRSTFRQMLRSFIHGSTESKKSNQSEQYSQ